MRSRCTAERNLPIAQENTCPFYSGEMTVCGASLSSMVADRTRQETFCLDTDRYDDCPMFLGRVLRTI